MVTSGGGKKDGVSTTFWIAAVIVVAAVAVIALAAVVAVTVLAKKTKALTAEAHEVGGVELATNVRVLTNLSDEDIKQQAVVDSL